MILHGYAPSLIKFAIGEMNLMLLQMETQAEAERGSEGLVSSNWLLSPGIGAMQ